jgi:hypothetical protein
MRIKDARQRELAAAVDHVVTLDDRKFIALSDRDNAVILNDQRAIADYSAARINRDEIVDVVNDEARHLATKLPIHRSGDIQRHSCSNGAMMSTQFPALDAGRIGSAQPAIESDTLYCAPIMGVAFIQRGRS